MRIKNVNIYIAFTHIVTRKRQTLVAAMGVMIGIGIYLFMNSLTMGFSSYSRNEIFKNNAHIKIYKEDKISKPLLNSTASMPVMLNPQIIKESKTLINPFLILNTLKKNTNVTFAIAQVNADVFYNNGHTQLKGTANGVNILEANKMFNIESYMLAGDLNDLNGTINGIIIGKGIAENLNIVKNDILTVTSALGVNKQLRVVGIFSTGNALTDKTKSYVNISTAQQLLKECATFVTTIYANTNNADHAVEYAASIQKIVPYTVEPWQVTNADVLSGDKVRNTLMSAISISILIVAAFGIYNILNMTVVQKVNDIAILKATGYSGRDVITIFVFEAIIMGLIGSLVGLLLGAVLIEIVSNIYMGGPVGYFPVYFDTGLFIKSLFLGLIITFIAGYIPALKASKVDPIEIFRK